MAPLVQRLGSFVVLTVLGCGGSRPRDWAPTAGDRVTAEPAAAVALPDSQPLPDLELPDLAAHTVSLSPGAHDVTLINFWATWCGPCLKEIPELVALNERGGPGLRVVGVSIASGSRGDIRAFATKHAMDYLLLDADEEWGHRYFQALGLPLFLPVTLVVDRHGVIRRRLIGPHTRAEFEAAIAFLK